MCLTTDRKRIELIRGDTIVPQEMTWLWYPYIPMGAATMLFGPGGAGKSTISCAITAAITTGRPLPGQGHYPPRPKQHVLMMSSEDDLDVVLGPRLIRAEAEMSNVFFPTQPFTLDANGVKSMREFMQECAATVVFIDPIVHYMGGKIDMNKMNEVRSLMGVLHQTARETKTAMIVVHHARKGRGEGDADDHEKAAGSADFVNATRSVLFTSKTPAGARIMRHVKSNYAPTGLAIEYDLGGDFGEEGEVGTFSWGDMYEEGDMPDVADQGPRRRGAKREPRHAAEAFLRAFLADGPILAKEVIDAAEDNSITERTLNRAKAGIAESFFRAEEGGKMVWYWRLLDRPPVASGRS